ncbi:AfsR/SARP family transcriptional regulator [Streptomyces tremellae]
MSAAQEVRVAVLGPLVIRSAAGGVVPVAGSRIGSLVIRLVLAHGRPVSLHQLIDDLWIGEAPAHPRGAVQALVSRLRRNAAKLPIVLGPGGYTLDLPAEAVDLWRFEELAARGHAELADRPGEAARMLREGLALWRGEEFTEARGALFAQSAAVRVAELRRRALADRVDADLALGRAAEILPELEELVAAAPADERWHARLMGALHAVGRRADALDVYARVRTVLADELGLDPSSALRDVHLAVLRGEAPAPGATESTGPAAGRRPGDPPVPLSGSAPAATGPDGRPTAPDRPPRLPVPPTTLVGREDELTALRGLLDEARLVSVIGPGGVGKTRLVAEAASLLSGRFEDGVWWVDLTVVRDPARLDEEVRACLAGVGTTVLDGARAAPHGGPERLADLVGGRGILLVLDNCEHVVEPAAELVGELLIRCPALHVVATSREPLAAPGERILPLGPLAPPPDDATLDQVRASPAVRLLAERTRALRPSFTVDASNAADTARISRRLDGLPLALELAAARLRALSPGEAADRFDDHLQLLSDGRRGRPARHRTLSAVIDWSWELLRPEEQVLARRLAVFSGGATLDAIEEICAGCLPRSVLDLVTALVDKSLLYLTEDRGRTRYRMLGVIRDYLAERLGDREERGLREAHARYFLRLAETAGPRLIGADQVRWLVRLADDHDNLRAALSWAASCGQGTVALRLVAALSWYWSLRGRQTEGSDWARHALAADDAMGGDVQEDVRVLVMIVATLAPGADPAERSTALDKIRDRLGPHRSVRPPGDRERPELTAFRATLSLLGQDPGTALKDMEALSEDPQTWVRCCGHLNAGHLCSARRDVPAATRHFWAAVHDARGIGERWAQVQALSALADLASAASDPEEAAGLLEEALRLATELGALDDQVLLLARLSVEEARAGRLPRARELVEEGLRTARRTGATRCLPQIRGAYGDVARWSGDLEGAAAVLGRGLGALRTAQHRDSGQLALLACGLGHVEVARHRMGPARHCYDEALAHALPLGDARLAGRVLLLGADLTAEHGDPVRALPLLGAAETLTGTAAAGDLDALRIRDSCARTVPGAQLASALETGRSYAEDSGGTGLATLFERLPAGGGGRRPRAAGALRRL